MQHREAKMCKTWKPGTGWRETRSMYPIWVLLGGECGKKKCLSVNLWELPRIEESQQFLDSGSLPNL